MPLMTWNDKMSVAVHSFDSDHKRLLALINDLFDAMQAGKSRDVLGRILDGLISYTKFHFKREEEQLSRLGFAEFAVHQKQHQGFTTRVAEVQARFNAGATSALSLDILTLLRDWLVNHIQGTDKRYGAFLNAKGVR